ncbi:hypothetical protein CYMTET_26297 [Cymbomonas tetramitiformis]|uniref:Exonuclease 1 n=1 Tax=Cymbomonas tetramitiformis TaxID=36881 RepID=A0AAE0KYA5_9CHLO|nr:hypothetical protein CYMTET_26297 [Cymbomonas tetramitiformis]
MGIEGLHSLLRDYGDSIVSASHIEKYSGQRIAADAYSWLHKGAYSCAGYVCKNQKPWEAKGHPPPYVNYCMQMVQCMKRHGVIPIIVFDGDRLPAKAQTLDKRSFSRQENLAKAKEYEAEGNTSQAEVYYQRGVRVTPDMSAALIQALKQEGTEFLVAPYEADAQMAALSSMPQDVGGVAAVVTEDGDLLCYRGVKTVLFKLNKVGHCQEVVVEKLFHTGDHVDELPTQRAPFTNWDHSLFVGMCVLAGCDFLESVKNMGMKTAKMYVSKYRNLDRVLRMMKQDKKLKVPNDYAENFKKAMATFHHARVYDPRIKALVPLHPLPPELEAPGACTRHLGPDIDPTVAQGIAEGRVNPVTRELLRLPGRGSSGSPRPASRDTLTPYNPAHPVRYCHVAAPPEGTAWVQNTAAASCPRFPLPEDSWQAPQLDLSIQHLAERHQGTATKVVACHETDRSPSPEAVAPSASWKRPRDVTASGGLRPAEQDLEVTGRSAHAVEAEAAGPACRTAGRGEWFCQRCGESNVTSAAVCEVCGTVRRHESAGVPRGGWAATSDRPGQTADSPKTFHMIRGSSRSTHLNMLHPIEPTTTAAHATPADWWGTGANPTRCVRDDVDMTEPLPKENPDNQVEDTTRADSSDAGIVEASQLDGPHRHQTTVPGPTTSQARSPSLSPRGAPMAYAPSPNRQERGLSNPFDTAGQSHEVDKRKASRISELFTRREHKLGPPIPLGGNSAAFEAARQCTAAMPPRAAERALQCAAAVPPLAAEPQPLHVRRSKNPLLGIHQFFAPSKGSCAATECSEGVNSSNMNKATPSGAIKAAKSKTAHRMQGRRQKRKKGS